MAANVLNSDVAIDASIMIVRVFVRLKELVHEHSDLKKWSSPIFIESVSFIF